MPNVMEPPRRHPQGVDDLVSLMNSARASTYNRTKCPECGKAVRAITWATPYEDRVQAGYLWICAPCNWESSKHVH
jgi:C4-type Zn-finger protein